MSDRIRTAPDTVFRTGGEGLAYTWRCLGCGLNRPTLGSTGVGIRKRCRQCTAARAARSAAAAPGDRRA